MNRYELSSIPVFFVIMMCDHYVDGISQSDNRPIII